MRLTGPHLAIDLAADTVTITGEVDQVVEALDGYRRVGYDRAADDTVTIYLAGADPVAVVPTIAGEDGPWEVPGYVLGCTCQWDADALAALTVVAASAPQAYMSTWAAFAATMELPGAPIDGHPLEQAGWTADGVGGLASPDGAWGATRNPAGLWQLRQLPQAQQPTIAPDEHGDNDTTADAANAPSEATDEQPDESGTAAEVAEPEADAEPDLEAELVENVPNPAVDSETSLEQPAREDPPGRRRRRRAPVPVRTPAELDVDVDTSDLEPARQLVAGDIPNEAEDQQQLIDQLRKAHKELARRRKDLQRPPVNPQIVQRLAERVDVDIAAGTGPELRAAEDTLKAATYGLADHHLSSIQTLVRLAKVADNLGDTDLAAQVAELQAAHDALTEAHRDLIPGII